MTEKKKSVREEHGGNDDWKSLIAYVKNQVMRLPNSPFPNYLTLRLDGFSKGQYISNNNVEQKACYQYKDMHEAFKIAKNELDKKKDIIDALERLNYALAIVGSVINDIVIRREAQEKAIQKLHNIDFSYMNNEKAEYKSQTTETPKNLEHLW